MAQTTIETQNIGPDDVLQIYLTLSGGTTFFMNMSLDESAKDDCFSYDGINMHPKDHSAPAKATLKTENAFKYYIANTTFLEYGSNSPPGKSLRLGICAIPGSKGQVQRHTWKEKPEFLYDPKGIRNHEFTGFIRLHGDLNKGITDKNEKIHRALAFKVFGANDDKGRSVLETCYPVDESDHVRANYDYEHFPYVYVRKTDAGGGIKQFFSGDYCQENKWVGLKHIHITDGKTQSLNRLYVDTDPFDDNGKPRNNWKLKAEYVDKGSTEKDKDPHTGKMEGYDGIPCTWASQVDKIRIDGWDHVDFTLLSIREIDPNASPSVSSSRAAAAEMVTEQSEIDDTLYWNHNGDPC